MKLKNYKKRARVSIGERGVWSYRDNVPAKSRAREKILEYMESESQDTDEAS